MNDQPTTLKPDERFICVHIIIDASAPYLGVAPANNWIGRLVLDELLRQSIEAGGTLVSERGATGELNRSDFLFHQKRFEPGGLRHQDGAGQLHTA